MGIDYALAKELEVARFPQSGKGGHIGPPDKIVWRSADRVYVPTLSELIDSCWAVFFRLSRKSDGEWLAESRDLETGEGLTPEEAVARLFLALKK
jgi:hypothetical protein